MLFVAVALHCLSFSRLALPLHFCAQPCFAYQRHAFANLRCALPARCGSQPSSAMPSPVCTLPRLRSAVQCQRKLLQCLFSAKLSYTVATQCNALPRPCLASHCHRYAHQCHRISKPHSASATQRPRQYLTIPSPRLSFRCYAMTVLRPCATPPHRGPLFRREADRRCAIARHSFAAAKPHHACAHRFPAVPMRCMSSLCNALPAQRSAVPMHYHSCAHQYRCPA